MLSISEGLPRERIRPRRSGHLRGRVATPGVCPLLHTHTTSVFRFTRICPDAESNSPATPKNQIWDKSRSQWYLFHSGCGIKSGIHTTFLARSCGSTVNQQNLGKPAQLSNHKWKTLCCTHHTHARETTHYVITERAVCSETR